ncbi:MAG: hypothetical protein N0C84_00525 [Candidatus Thiodiazotropha taylori]|uniref:Uncharacterized protein n=1 Tax=Candidatus Thiodiazotropha taylori TaxID=2792791 RepID=A0A9E4K9X2_9GAMM|nr:hypothetical protein [Candidatus Thiodiazotropha taylori]MCW4254929.1 hypothetical protein [Candidatus Thiodiazotropha taylori]
MIKAYDIELVNGFKTQVYLRENKYKVVDQRVNNDFQIECLIETFDGVKGWVVLNEIH